MNHTPERETPDARVAHQIVARCVAEGILPPQFADRLLTQLADGFMRESDWRSLARQILIWELEAGDDDRLLAIAKWVLEKLGSPTLG